MQDLAVRQQVIDAAQEMARLGLSPQRSGNVSARAGDFVFITPSATDYGDLQVADIAKLTLSGKHISGQKKPSSETPLHLAIYNAFVKARAVVHCHSLFATVLACARVPIPAFHYMVAVAGGDQIPLSGYARFGSRKLADNVVATLAGYRACLMANHGQIAFHDNLPAAVELAGEVETLARQYTEILKLGRPNLLNREEMAAVINRFADYKPQTRMATKY